MALEHFVLVVVRVLRGPTSADETAKKIQYLIHCQWCEERIFQKDGNMVEGKRSSLAWVGIVYQHPANKPASHASYTLRTVRSETTAGEVNCSGPAVF